MPKPINMEWRAYDTNELTVTYAEHVGVTVSHDDGSDMVTCCACWAIIGYDPSTCDIDITEPYRNLTRNLAVAIALAAAGQAAVDDWRAR